MHPAADVVFDGLKKKKNKKKPAKKTYIYISFSKFEKNFVILFSYAQI